MNTFNIELEDSASLAADVTSAGVQFQRFKGISIAVVITGSPVGTLKLQGSCDPAIDGGMSTPVPTTWIDITSSSQSISGATNVLYNLINQSYNWIRLVYTRSSGSGTLAARVNAKE